LDRKSENLDTLSQKTGKNSQVPDVVPKNDPSNESSTLLENTNTDDKSNLLLDDWLSSDEYSDEMIPVEAGGSLILRWRVLWKTFSEL
jgi:hypothetical protein